MAAWLTDVRQELLAAVESALQLLGLMRDEAARGDAPGELRADLDHLQHAASNFLLQAAGLHVDPAVADDPEAQKEFFAKVRHDLLTPVGQLIGYCELLEEELEPPWAERFADDLAQLLSAARHMQSRIDDLLKLRIRETPAVPEVRGDARKALADRPDHQPGHVLVVDDSQLNRHLLGRWLTKHGHTVAFAADGVEALAKIDAGAFDLVLLDVVMPNLNGFEVLTRLKTDPRLRHLPVVMISALSEFDRVVQCIAIGAEDYLPKPFEPVLLEARIGACLEQKRFRDREMEYLRQIETEKQRYDELLHVMLPGEVVKELKETGSVASRRYDNVAVMFADIVGFTSFCDGHPPEEVVSLLQDVVRSFEEVAERWNVQKIKTIGDAFLAVAGLLRPVDNSVESCVRCGVEMLQAAKEKPPHWDLRIGIHHGPIVAGLLGNKLDLFDLFGDTVNTAARVEQNGTAGAITLTAAAWERIADKAVGELRGEVQAKGKGAIELVRFTGFGNVQR